MANSEVLITGWHVRMSFSPCPGYYTQQWADVTCEQEIALSEGEADDVMVVEEVRQPQSWWDALEARGEFSGW